MELVYLVIWSESPEEPEIHTFDKIEKEQRIWEDPKTLKSLKTIALGVDCCDYIPELKENGHLQSVIKAPLLGAGEEGHTFYG